jgi:hypothetical protein
VIPFQDLVIGVTALEFTRFSRPRRHSGRFPRLTAPARRRSSAWKSKEGDLRQRCLFAPAIPSAGRRVQVGR